MRKETKGFRRGKALPLILQAEEGEKGGEGVEKRQPGLKSLLQASHRNMRQNRGVLRYANRPEARAYGCLKGRGVFFERSGLSRRGGARGGGSWGEADGESALRGKRQQLEKKKGDGG